MSKMSSVEVQHHLTSGPSTVEPKQKRSKRPFVWGAIDFARQQGATTGIVCCVRLSALRRPPRRAGLVPAVPEGAAAFSEAP